MFVIKSKASFVEKLVYILFFFLPFSYLISKTIFKELDILNISLINLMFDIIIIIVAVDSLVNRSKYHNISHIWIYYIIFLILNIFKILNQANGFEKFMESLPVRLYYFFIPLVYIMLKNEKLDLKRISTNLIRSTIIICPLSIYMFLTSNYFGMVDEQLMLVYKIIGTSFSRMFSIFGSPLVAGTFFSIIVILIIYGNKYKEFEGKILLLLNFICLILTFSRTAFIVLIIVATLKCFNDDNIKIKNKIICGISIILLAILIIVFSYYKGIYFWNTKDIFHNVRFDKWGSTFSVIKKNILFGSEFILHISSLNTVKTTLSDNSLLLFLGYYGIILTIMLIGLCINQFIKKEKYIRKAMRPIIICAVMFCLFYDFVQLFPSNYLLIFLYIYTEQIIKSDKAKNKNEV